MIRTAKVLIILITAAAGSPSLAVNAQVHPTRSGKYTSLPTVHDQHGAFNAGGADANLVTGSILPGRAIDQSAKGGNAEQPERAVPQFGSTAGGPSY